MRVAIINDKYSKKDIKKAVCLAKELSDEITVLNFDTYTSYLDKLAVDTICHFSTSSLCCGEFSLNDTLKYCKEHPFEIIISISGNHSDPFSAKLSYSLGGSCFTDIIALKNDNGNLMLQRNCYSYNIISSHIVKKYPLVITLSKDSFIESDEVGSPKIINIKGDFDDSFIISRTDEIHQLETGLKNCKVAFIGGAGISSKEKITQLEQISEKVGAALGATRPVVYKGYAQSERLIGVSGLSISPELCIVFASSGSRAFLSGIEGSRIIVAINKDPNALIFDYCDFGVVGDVNSIIDNLTAVQ